MVARVIVLGCGLLVLGGLSHDLSRAENAAPAEPKALAFFVYDRDPRGPIVAQAGIRCMALRESGVVQLGVTTARGEVTVPYTSLFEPGNLAVLFCPPASEVQCTALRLDVAHLRGFAEYNVRVTQPEIIDRTPARGR
jgi:hypothetical protein